LPANAFLSVPFFLLYFVRDASGKNSVIKNEKSLALDMCFCNGGGCLAVWYAKKQELILGHGEINWKYHFLTRPYFVNES